MSSSSPESLALGGLRPLPGGDADVLAVSDGQIATLTASRATWWVGDVPRTVALPGIAVQGARWSTDGQAILVGYGHVEIAAARWVPHPALPPGNPPGPGDGLMQLCAASWSGDGRNAALLYCWQGPLRGAPPPPRLRLLDGQVIRWECDIPGASDVVLSGDGIIVAGRSSLVLGLDGTPRAELPHALGTPRRLKPGRRGAILVTADGTLHLVDAAAGRVAAHWRGAFHDACELPDEDVVLAIGFEGRLHAARAEAGSLREVGACETGVLDPRIAVDRNQRLVIAGAGPVTVQVATLTLGFPAPR